jgi:hypothetical protein
MFPRKRSRLLGFRSVLRCRADWQICSRHETHGEDIRVWVKLAYRAKQQGTVKRSCK